MPMSQKIALVFVFCTVSLTMRVRKEASVLTEVNKVSEEQDTGAEQGSMPVMAEDANPIGIVTIPAAFIPMVRVFGGGNPDGIAVEDLRRVTIDRRFPASYSFSKEIQAPDRKIQPHYISQVRGNRWKGGKGDNAPFVPAHLANIFFITCPFLSTLVNEGALEVKPEYTRDELEQVSIDAGVPEGLAQVHTANNFRNIPSGIQDIFNMEGVTNEHVSSTGITDCPTAFRDCGGEEGAMSCKSWTSRVCRYPDPAAWEDFVAAVDTNGDGFIAIPELVAAGARAEAMGFPINPPE